MNSIIAIFLVFSSQGASAFRLSGYAYPRSTAIQMSDSAPVPVTLHRELSVQTLRGISILDITSGKWSIQYVITHSSLTKIDVNECLKLSGCQEGVVTVLSRHSTVSVTINEFESRFVDDMRQFLLNLAPPHYPYLHNDLDFRYIPSLRETQF